MSAVKKLVLINLLGENRKQEKKRLLHARVKEIIKGTNPMIINEIKRGGKKYLLGTTAYQRKLRRNSIKKYLKWEEISKKLKNLQRIWIMKELKGGTNIKNDKKNKNR